MAEDTTIKDPGRSYVNKPAPYSGFGLGPITIAPSAEDTAQAIVAQEQIIYYGGGGSSSPLGNSMQGSNSALLIMGLALIWIIK